MGIKLLLIAAVVSAVAFVAFTKFNTSTSNLSKQQRRGSGLAQAHASSSGYIKPLPQGGQGPSPGTESRPSTTMTSTVLPDRRVYWTIPRIKNPRGGWDSIDGWHDASAPDRFTETWLDTF